MKKSTWILVILFLIDGVIYFYTKEVMYVVAFNAFLLILGIIYRIYRPLALTNGRDTTRQRIV